ncbi:sporulation protein [Marinobacterium jannaschii]|uniref:sporulation protein n=1 Tax=Marinobacterium jannaschii TaxID=64970 RepID=UPI000489CF82|nr:sporulation protein [Marinobacterium jannaschii]
MFKKILASVGIGAAKVDTQLESEQLMPGESFQAQILIQGGDVEQDISGMTLALMTQAEVETDDGEHHENIVLQSWKISESFTLQPGEEKVIPFNGVIHPETPLTQLQCGYNKSRVWLKTGLEIDLALDAGDKDFIAVLPTPAMARFLQAMDQCGYSMASADVEKGYLNGDGFRSTTGCYQELEFRPSGLARFAIKEVEVSFVPGAGVTHALIEVDRTFRGDGYLSLTWPDDASVEQLERQIAGCLN